MFLEALLHQLSAKARMCYSTIAILQQEQSSLLEIHLESTIFLCGDNNGFELLGFVCVLLSAVRAVQT